MAQTQTPTRARGTPLSQQAPTEAPAGNLPATRPRGEPGGAQPQAQQQQGNGTRGLTAAEREAANARNGQLASRNVQEIFQQFRGQLDAWCNTVMDGVKHNQVMFFKNIMLAAVSDKPELLFADRGTLFTAARKAFNDGLYPDGRDAALVVYKTKVKRRNAEGIDIEFDIQAVQYMPMVQGIRRRMLESGLVTSVTTEAVYLNDHFDYAFGDNAFIEHKAPPLGQDRGALIGAYCIIRLGNGDVLRDVMDRKAIEQAKSKSRAPNSLMWKDFEGEAFKKTVARRLSKSAPSMPNIARMFDAEEDYIDGEIDEAGSVRGGPSFDFPTTGAAASSEREPEAPLPTGQRQREPEPPLEVEFWIYDLDGVEAKFETPFAAFDGCVAVLSAAAAIGVAQLDGFWESNQNLLDALELSGNGNLSGELATRFADARDKAVEAEDKRKAEEAELAQREQAARQADEQAKADQAKRQQAQTGSTAAPADQQQPAQEQSERDPPPPEDEGQAPEPVVEEQQRASKRIDVPKGRDGKPDLRVWSVALFTPKVKATKSSADLAWLLGDNTDTLEKCKEEGVLAKADRDAMVAAIDAQFAKLPADS